MSLRKAEAAAAVKVEQTVRVECCFCRERLEVLTVPDALRFGWLKIKPAHGLGPTVDKHWRTHLAWCRACAWRFKVEGARRPGGPTQIAGAK